MSNHKLLIEQKKDVNWWKEVFNEYAPFGAITNNNRDRLLMIYGIVNNDVSAIQEYLNALNDPTDGLYRVDFKDRLAENILMYNKIYSKYEYHVNQIKNRVDNYEIIPHSDAANEFKANEYNEVVSEFVQRQMLAIQDIQNKLVSGEIQQQQAQAMMSELQQESPPDYDNFTSSLERFLSDMLDYFHFKYPVKQLKELSARHVLCSDDIFVGIVDNGQPEPVVFNPINISYLKSNEEPEVEKSQYFLDKKYVLLSDAYTEILEFGEKDDLDKFNRFKGGMGLVDVETNSFDSIKAGKAYLQTDYSSVHYSKMVHGRLDHNIGQAMGKANTHTTAHEDYILRTYLVIKGFEKVKELTYVDEYGKTLIDFVSLDYKIPKKANDIIITDPYGKKIKKKEWIDDLGNPRSIREITISRIYHGVRYDDLDVYIKLGELPYQNFNADELNIKGRTISATNSYSVSLVERGLPAFGQILFAKHLQNREMSKYKGVVQNIDGAQIPDYLTKDEKGEPLFDGADKVQIHQYIERVLGISVTDSGAQKFGMSPNLNKPKAINFEVSPGLAELLNLQNYIDLLDRELSIQMLVPPNAEGVVQPYTTKADNEAARANAYVMASGYYDAISEVWRKVIEEYLIQMMNYYKRYFEDHPDQTEVNLNYIVSDGSRKLLKIIPEYLDFTELGVYLKDSNQNVRYRQLMEAYTLQALSQNRGEGAEMLSRIAKSMSRGDSPETIHKMITIASREQQERVHRQNKELEQIKLQAEQEKNRQIQLEIDGKKEIEHIKGQYNLEEKAMDVHKFQQELDADNNGVNDAVETLLAVKKIEQADRKLDQEDLKIKNEQRKLNQPVKTSAK
jgi:hypothetical protein